MSERYLILTFRTEDQRLVRLRVAESRIAQVVLTAIIDNDWKMEAAKLA